MNTFGQIVLGSLLGQLIYRTNEKLGLLHPLVLGGIFVVLMIIGLIGLIISFYEKSDDKED